MDHIILRLGLPQWRFALSEFSRSVMGFLFVFYSTAAMVLGHIARL